MYAVESIFLFLQAEDGIRDVAVTGVQTCALPISSDSASSGFGWTSTMMPSAPAAIAAGADGIMVEVHPNPEEALSDGAQSLFPDQFAQLMRDRKSVV